MAAFKQWDEIWIDGILATITQVSKPFKFGNITDSSGNPVTGREYTIFIEEEEWELI